MQKIANNEALTVSGVQSMLKSDDAFKKAADEKKAAVAAAEKQVADAKNMKDSRSEGSKWADTGITTAKYAAGGAVIGSVIPVVGTAVGGVIGAATGFVKGLWDNWVSDSDEQKSAANAATAQLEKAKADLATVQSTASVATAASPTQDMASWFGTNSVMTPTAFTPVATDATYVGTSNALQNYNEPGILQVRDNNAQFVIDGITAALQSTFGSIGSSGDVDQRQACYLQQIVARTEGGAAAAMANLDTNTKTLTNQTIQTKQADIRGIVHQKSFEYQAKIQNELVAQMATANVILDAILESTEAGKNINLSGRKVNSALLQQNRTNYAIAMKPQT